MNAPEKTFKSMATWQTPPSKITNPQFPVTALNNLVLRVPPVVTKPDQRTCGVRSELGQRDRHRPFCSRRSSPGWSWD